VRKSQLTKECNKIIIDLLSGVGNKITLIYESFYITEVLGISPEEIKINLHDFLEILYLIR
jgi:hypothetical protein